MNEADVQAEALKWLRYAQEDCDTALHTCHFERSEKSAFPRLAQGAQIRKADFSTPLTPRSK